MSIGYHASHEQFAPSDLLEYVQQASNSGFEHCLASDHFHPWSERQGESGHVWSWLGAAMQATPMTFGMVNAPGYRYHPAIIAQAAATLRELYPERLWMSVGSGQLLNEGVAGVDWPVKADRNERLEECAEIMRRLWDGEEVTHDGHVTVERATLYTRPESPPPLLGAALSEETARWLGTWADGMITLGTPDHEADAARIEAFREDDPDAEKPVYLKVQLSYDESHDAALEGAYDQWRTNCIPGSVTQQLRTPAEFDELGETVDRAQVEENVRVSASLEEHVEWLERDFDHGVDRVYLHNVNTNQEAFIEDFGEGVLSQVSGT
ncbi:TIGR03885 family FMN-dependent LLM class oxidoreductase [Natronosalvus vescus]|uniref:TIGR03885 family FMN-dependent LLM class oxidoreductase n=1 Tax=Natronosalvus vescus TaxID=2953881 RepID=UPI002090BF31|nr:TIGR03885 family FMN-dependent LLM class oxidoreductase [Natronosalvus vescus]